MSCFLCRVPQFNLSNQAEMEKRYRTDTSVGELVIWIPVRRKCIAIRKVYIYSREGLLVHSFGIIISFSFYIFSILASIFISKFSAIPSTPQPFKMQFTHIPTLLTLLLASISSTTNAAPVATCGGSGLSFMVPPPPCLVRSSIQSNSLSYTYSNSISRTNASPP